MKMKEWSRRKENKQKDKEGLLSSTRPFVRDIGKS
jgi:hypothetical protein